MFANKSLVIWVLNYLQTTLSLTPNEADKYYEYLKSWDGDYRGIVALFGKYSPSRSIPTLIYGLSVIGGESTGYLELGRATYTLVSSYQLNDVAPSVFSFIKSHQLEKDYLTLPDVGKRNVNFSDRMQGVLDVPPGWRARRISTALYYLSTGIAAIYDISKKDSVTKWNSEIKNAINVHIPTWLNSFEIFNPRIKTHVEEIMEICTDIKQGRFTYNGR